MSKAVSLASTPLDLLLCDLQTSREGLTESEALAPKRYGPNDALGRERHPLAIQFLLRFFNPLILILLFASALSALAGDRASFLIVVVIVTLSVTLDFVQELHAHNATPQRRGRPRRPPRRSATRRRPCGRRCRARVASLNGATSPAADCRCVECFRTSSGAP